MTTITLPPDLVARLAEAAKREGMSVEEFALSRLRRFVLAERGERSAGQTLLDVLKPVVGAIEGLSDLSQSTGRTFEETLEPPTEGESLYDALKPFVGVIDGPGGSFGRHTGRDFGDILMEKERRRRGRST